MKQQLIKFFQSFVEHLFCCRHVLGRGVGANVVQPLPLRGSWGARQGSQQGNWQLGYHRLKSRLVSRGAEVKEYFLEEVTPEGQVESVCGEVRRVG